MAAFDPLADLSVPSGTQVHVVVPTTLGLSGGGPPDTSGPPPPSQDELGWTDLTPAVDARVRYVANAPLGNDITGDGLTELTPYATIDAGMADMRDGFPDQLLFRRGDTWGTIAVLYGGRSVTEKAVIGAWGPETDPRPHFLRATPGTILGLRNETSNIIFVSLHISHDYVAPYPASLGFGIAPAGSPAQTATRSNVIFEDLLVEHCQNGFNSQVPMNGVRFRRCFIQNCYGIGWQLSTDSGIDWVDAAFEECTFDYCGWGATNDDQDDRRRALYVTDSIQIGVNCTGCYFIRGSSGDQFRTGGAMSRNVRIQVPIPSVGFLTGGGTAVPGGTSWTWDECLSLEANDIGETPFQANEGYRGVGVQAGNTNTGSSVTNSLFVHALTGVVPPSSAGSPVAVNLRGASGQPEVGVHNVTLDGNFCYNAGNFQAVSTMTVGQVGNDGLTNLTVTNNTLICTTGNQRIYVWAANIENELTVSGNDYYSPNSIPFQTGGVNESFAQWVSRTGDTSSFLPLEPTFTDPTRGYVSFRDQVESTSGSTLDDFVDELKARRKGNWRTEYDTVEFINHVREGFDLTLLT